MANYCMNKLTILGKTKEIIRFKETVWKSKDEPLNFQTTIPMPDELANTQSPSNLSKIKQANLIKKYGHTDWHSWQIANWGCKWGPYKDSMTKPTQTNYKNGKTKIIYEYDTPWSPPTQWLINTSKQFPKLKFQNYYNEPGMRFKGTETIINGKIIKNTINNY